MPVIQRRAIEISSQLYICVGFQLNGIKNHWLKVFSIFYVTICVVLFALIVWIDFLQTTDFIEILNKMGKVVKIILVPIKIFHLYRKRNNINRINEMIKTIDMKLSGDEEVETVIKRSDDLTLKFLKVILYLLAITIFCVLSFGLISWRKILAIPAYYPLDWHNSDLSATIIFIHQASATVPGGCISLLNEVMICCYLLIIAEYYNCIIFFVKKITPLTRFNNSSQYNWEEQRNIDYLSKILEVHDDIIEMTKTVSSTYLLTLFLEFILTTLIFCSTMFVLAQVFIIN